MSDLLKTQITGECTVHPSAEDNAFDQILDSLKISIYITDIETDEIIYMNQTMKDEYGLQHPEGEKCWKLLQKGKSGRCEFCPIDRLKLHAGRNHIYQWNEISPVTRRSYCNYDSFMKWTDGRTVHMQQSVDVTDMKSSNTDELTQLMTRRGGKELLKDELRQLQEDGQTRTVCLYDINLLKEVNDTHGHVEGDRLILMISEAVRAELSDAEFAFRLSGDEFVIVFRCSQRHAMKRAERIIKKIREIRQDYDMGFCFGLAECTAERMMTADELLFLADKRMYEQKRQLHIRRNEEQLLTEGAVKRSEAFTYDKESLYDALIRSTDDYLYICNMKTGIFKYAKAMVEEFDLPGEVIENAAAIWGGRVHPDDRSAFLEANQEIADGRALSHCVEYRALNRKGEWVWVRCRGYLELDDNGEPLLFAGFITNLGKKNRIDNLTGLFNKLAFEEDMGQLLEMKQSFAVMLLGIDDLKHINDLYDRFFGDEVIRITSQRIQSLLPPGAVVFRLDGDVFGIISRDSGSEEMERLYRAVYHSFENQQTCEGRKYYSTLSGGCLFCPADAGTYENAVKYVNYCLEYSKQHGKKQCTFFSEEILGSRAHSLAMVEQLRESVENDFKGFRLVYQPLVHAADGRLLGAEALARWECEEFGQVSPLEFIPLLETTGLIVPVGKWILRTAVDTCSKWVRENPEFVIDVNLSYVQIRDAGFFPFLHSVMKESQFPPDNLVLELTESYFVKEQERISDIFLGIRNMGIRVAMDDFGTGYSSLGILKESPADIVKIDKTFIRDIGNSNFDATFIRFVVALCHDVGIGVCLEGVETQETYEIVGPMGLDIIQGYLFDRPLEEDRFNRKYFGASD